MPKKARKAIILSLKIAISIALLWWVLKGVTWQDFVLGVDGRTHIAVQEMRPAGEGVFTLVLPDGTQTVKPASVLAPVKPNGGDGVDNYRRPGFLRVIRGINIPLLVVAGLLAPIQIFVMGFRWWRLLHVQGIDMSYREALRLTWLGTFFNYIVLGTTGGDVVKAWYAAQHTPHKTECLVTVFLDRLVGLIGLTVLSSVMLAVVMICRILGAGHLFGPIDAGKLHLAALVAGSVLAGLLALGALSLSSRLRRLLHLNQLYHRLPMRSQVTRVGDSLRLFRHRLGALGKAMGQTLSVHLMFVLSIGLCGASLYLRIPWYQYVIYIPLIYIIAAVPIVPGGVGLAEGMFVTFFGVWADQSQILALALLARLVPMFWALPGILVAISGPKLPPAEQMQAEMADSEAQEPALDAQPASLPADTNP
jgi:hypothetical protein